jgi:uncharacterized protein
MLGKLNIVEIEEVLKQNFLGHIGCYANGRIYVVPMSYAYEEGYIYAHAYEGMKINMMRQNPKICFEVDVMKDMSNWKTVIAWGDFEELTEAEERNHALKILVNRKLPTLSSITAKFSKDWPFFSDDYNEIEGIVFRIFLTEKTGRFELSTSTTFSYIM